MKFPKTKDVGSQDRLGGSPDTLATVDLGRAQRTVYGTGCASSVVSKESVPTG